MAVDILPLTKADIPGAVECIQKVFSDDPAFKWLFDNPDKKYNVKRNAASLAADLIYGLKCGAPIHVAKTTTTTPTPAPSPSSSIFEKKTETIFVSSDDSDSGYSSSSSQAHATTTDYSEDTTPTTTTSTTTQIIGVAVWLPPKPTHKSESWTVWSQERILSLRQLFNNVRFLGRGGLNLRRYWDCKASQKEAQDEVLWDPQGYYFCTFLAVSEEARGQGVGRMLVDMVTREADSEGIPCYLESSKAVPNVAIYRKMGFEVVKEIKFADGDDVCRLYGMIRQPRLKV